MSNQGTSINRYNAGLAFVEPPTVEIVGGPHEHMSQTEAALIAQGQGLANIAINGHMSQSRANQTDTAITHAQAHLIASLPTVGAVAGIVTGIVIVAGLLAGGPVVLWVGVELVAFGIGALVVLLRSRQAGLEHTPAGVERHEIDAKVKIAIHAIDRHSEALERIRGIR